MSVANEARDLGRSAGLGGSAGGVRAPTSCSRRPTPRSLTGNLADLADELDRRRPPIPIVVLASVPRAASRQARRRCVHTFRAGYHLATARAVRRGRLLLPDVRDPPRRGTTGSRSGTRPGRSRSSATASSTSRSGRTRTLVSRVDIHSNYNLALVSSMSVAPHYVDAFGSRAAIFTSALGLPRTDLFSDPEPRAARGRGDPGALRPPPGRRVVLYAPTFRGDTVGRPLRRLARPRASPPRLGDEWVVLLKLHPFVRDGVDIRRGAGGVRHRRVGRAGRERADARRRRAGHRLLERHLRVRAAGPADGVPRARRRRLRARARLLPRLPRDLPGPDLRDDRGAGGGDRAGAATWSGVLAPSRRRAST